MLHIKIDGGETMELDIRQGQVFIGGKPFEADITSIGKDKFHIIVNGRSVTAELVGRDESGKEMQLVVNGVKRHARVEDEHDLLLKRLGMDKAMASKVNDIKAPMPGLVLRILVKPGDQVEKGDTLLILEAMKMENVIKASAPGTVRKVNVSEKIAVEKNQVMIVME